MQRSDVWNATAGPAGPGRTTPVARLCELQFRAAFRLGEHIGGRPSPDVVVVHIETGREAEALVHMRTYQEEVDEALEATGLADTKDSAK